MKHHSITLAVLLAVSTVRAENWPQFRGATALGISKTTNLPVSWDGKKNVAWKTPIPGKGWSSPSLQDGRIYLTTAVSDVEDDARSSDGAQSLRALCIDAKSGSVTWSVPLFKHLAARIQRKNSHASPTPIVAGRHVFVHFGTQGTACLDVDGKVVWKNSEIVYSPVHGNGGSPVLVGEALIFSCDGREDPFVIALDRKTGQIRWRTDRPHSPELKHFAFSTPLAIPHGTKTQVVVPGANHVASYDPTSGSEIWRVAYPGGYSVVPRPVHGHGLVFMSTGFDTSRLLAIRPDGRGDVTESHMAWSSTSNVPRNSSFLIVGGELYTVSDKGIASCLDARTGTRHWRHRIGGNYSASPVLADGRIYFQNEEGEGVVIAPGKSYRELSRNPLNERTLASYAIGDGAIFIRSMEHLYRIEKPSAPASASSSTGTGK